MALHPDNIYEGLSKISQYCEQKIKPEDNSEADQYFRLFLYLPILLINDDLYELKYDEIKNPKLTKTECSLLLYNYYYESNPTMAYIFVVTKDGLPKLLNFMIETEKEIFEDIAERRKKGMK